uniref:NADH-ubiquinone oxidoreductase chain 2 n=1 Tax=[Candida] vartiovaarae TaxID=51918 RepID=S5TFZ7_9ASCO|nr:NADH dehydrogenase subunit 2 [[Candida] vartiovaarae]AGS44377.1 NADH dehydrogenase subunit 2 [[Candida] vartiovaarae]
MLIISLFILLIYSSVINTSESLLTNNRNIIKIGLLVLLYSLYMIIDNLIYYDNNILLFNDLYILNTFNIYFIILIYIIAMSLTTINIVNMSSINSISSVLKNYLNLNNFNRYYVTIILFNIIGIILFMTSNNIISIFIGIELQSYSLYILTGIPSKSNTSAHNSLFYYLIGGFGSIMILYGISLLYYTSGNIYLNNINILLDYTSFRSPLLMGYLFMIFGLLIKIGAGPMYNWSILLYMNSNTIITSYISIIPKLSILTYIWYLYNQLNISIDDLNNTINNGSGASWIDSKIILILSLIITISLIIGSISGLSQIKIKSILAYSGLLNIGYLVLSILINNINSLTAYIIYITQYSIGHVSMFLLLIIAAIYNNNHLIYTYEIKSIYKNSFLIASLLIIIGSFIGIPPLFGFYGKYYLLISSINSNYLFLSLLLIISSIIATLYYLYIINSVISDKNNNLVTPEYILSVGNTLSYVFSSFVMILLFNFIQWNNILKGAYIIATYI